MMEVMNTFVKTNLNKIYIVIIVLFWIMVMAGCEKEPITPYEKPSAVDPYEIAGEWNITKFYMLEEGFRLDVSAWVEYVNDSTFDIGTIEFNGIAEWKAEKPLCNVTPYEYLYVPATYYLGLDNEVWTTTYKTTNKWIIESIRRYDNQLPLTGDHYQYRELTLER